MEGFWQRRTCSGCRMENSLWLLNEAWTESVCVGGGRGMAREEALQGVQAGSGPGSWMGSTTRQTPWELWW